MGNGKSLAMLVYRSPCDPPLRGSVCEHSVRGPRLRGRRLGVVAAADVRRRVGRVVGDDVLVLRRALAVDAVLQSCRVRLDRYRYFGERLL